MRLTNFFYVQGLSGTATFFRCIPISVAPISIPASALIPSIDTGFLNDYRLVWQEIPPAFAVAQHLQLSAKG
jgi:hypothetical protein